MALEREQAVRGDGGTARRQACNVNCRIIEDKWGDRPQLFNKASQNVVAATMLLRMMPEPSTLEGRRVHDDLRRLLECVTVLQAEIPASRH